MAAWNATPAYARNLRRNPTFKPFKPYVPPPLPSGSYDPALDAARRAASRGLGDTTADVQTANTRDTVDYGLGRDKILQDQARGNEDIGRSVQMLQQSYQRLQNRQGQQINASGLGYGGAQLQAAAKRAANEATDMQPLDLARQRLGEDTTQQLGQLALELAPPGEGGPLGGRRFQDRTTQLSRAQREDLNFGLDTGAQKAFQAAGAGYVAPGRGEPGGIPRGEHVGAEGAHYRTVDRGGVRYYVDPSGRVLKKKRL